MCHKRIVITLEDVIALDHSADEVDSLLSGRPVVLRFLTLGEHVRVVVWNKSADATSNGFSILANSVSRSRLEAIYQENRT
jgi:hypothetical protein